MPRGPYDDRRATLDPGLTALALRARGEASGRYPFLERALRPRRWWLVVAGALAAWLAARRRRAPRIVRRGPDPRA
jgi:hypothetical protein